MAQSILPDSGIYAIRNKINGKVYIGSAVNITIRWYNHKSDLITGRHCNNKLLRSWVKHGANAFEFIVIEFVSDIHQLIAREQFWMDEMKAVITGYNIRPIAGSSLGVKDSDEVRAKKSAAHLGVRKSPEHIAKVAAALRGRVGVRLGAVTSAETRAKQSESAKKADWSHDRRYRLKELAEKTTPEQRTAMALKAWQTRRAKALIV